MFGRHDYTAELAQREAAQIERRAREREGTNARLCVPVVHARSAVVGGGLTGVNAAKPPEPVRDENYRRLVAGLPCFACRIEGHSQAAHPNTGKAKGKKLSDADCFPMCADRPGVKGCHSKFDQYELVPRAAMRGYEAVAVEWTRAQLEEQTL